MKASAARVVLTGASGGIGHASAAALLKAGASVMLVGRSAPRLAEQARQLVRETGVDASRVEHRLADLSRAEDLASLAVLAAGWGCNVLVHNAGLASFGRLQDLPAADVQAVLHTNLVAPMLLTQSLLPHLLAQAQAQAQVICVGSALGAIGLPGYSVYSASKFGLRGFAQALRRELCETRVRVQYLGPRSTRTAFNSEAVETYNRATGTAMDRPEQVALELLALMESEAAERFVGYPEKLAVRLNGLAPSWLDGSFKKHCHSLPPVAPALLAHS
ncbi:SDR family oxidoreductase [Hydrogenophaga sp. A37]|uniref:SDR family oxidoreductase n=1 Tax=Hydrogenophaga sp. A37 TaxID=1945864 RepID=UPI0009865703|nr:SDR family oxidoreductase [Hydrogenophaga sp. A37]OOG79621.1 short chain dehydrogenase [Hydrogenophaga sp. A37]